MNMKNLLNHENYLDLKQLIKQNQLKNSIDDINTNILRKKKLNH